jgi:hypothetical protein
VLKRLLATATARLIHCVPAEVGDGPMMGERTVMEEALFYGFSLEQHGPADHLLRSINRFVDLSGMREHLRPYHREIGRPLINPELIIRMLLVGYCFGIRSERRLCEEHLNLAIMDVEATTAVRQAEVSASRLAAPGCANDVQVAQSRRVVSNKQ